MCIFEVTVQPGVVDLSFIDLSGRQERLCIFAVDHVTVYIHIVERVVLTDTLRLIVELLRRSEIVDTDVVDRFGICRDVLGCQGVVSRKGFDVDIIQLVRVLRIFDISLKIFAFLINLIRRNDKVLHQIACAVSDQTDHDHDHRDREQALVFFAFHIDDEQDRRQYGQHT